MMRKIIIAMMIFCCIVPMACANINDYNASLKILLHGDGSEGGTIFSDATGRAWSANGDLTKTTQTNKYLGNASMVFGGSADWIATTDSSDFTIGSNPFTIVFYMDRDTTGSSKFLFGQIAASGADSTSSIYAILDAGNTITLNAYNGATVSATSTQTISSLTGFYQVAIIRNSTHVQMYIDGVDAGATALGGSISDSSATFSVGRAGEYAANTYGGYIDEFAFWNGVAIPISDLYPMPTEIGSSCGNYAIGGSKYCYGQQFNATANAGTGTLSAYQIMLNMSNSNGVSTSTILYTNGSTRTDWNDVVYTDGSNNQLPFWKENNTETATGATFWVKVPSITTGGNSVRAYFGNSSKSSSEMNGYNTFEVGSFDDFIINSLNTTQFADGGGNSISGGILTTTGSGAGTYEGIMTKIQYPVNTSVRGRALLKQAGDGGSFGWRNSFADSAAVNHSWIYYYSAGAAWQHQNYYSSGSSRVNTPSSASYKVYEIGRNSTTSSRIIVDFTEYQNAGSVNPNLINATFTLYAAQSPTLDWIFIRQYQYPEPTLSSFTGIPSGPTAPVAAFSGTPLSGHAPTTTTFTDASSGSPTYWNYTFGDGDFSHSQNPSHAYLTKGVYSVSLEVGNSAGNNTLTKTNYVTITNTSEIYPSFTTNATSGTYPFPVAFTSTTSTFNATIDSYLWQFGDGNTSASASPTYTYLGAGTFLANLTVTNSSFSLTNTSASTTITSTKASGVNTVDLNMAPQFSMVMHITDSETNAPIPVVLVTDSYTVSYTTTNGTAYFTEPFATAIWYLSADGYVSRSVSYVMDDNREVTVQMTPVDKITQNTNVLWSPRDVAIQVLDGNYNPIQNNPVHISAHSSSLPGGLSGAVEYFKNTYGVPESTAIDMLNSSTTYDAITDNYGFIAVQVVSVIQYSVVTPDVNGVDTTTLMWPAGAYYQIVTANATVPGIAAQGQAQNLIYKNSNFNTSYWQPNSSYSCMGVNVYDSTGQTTNVRAWWKLVDNGTVWWQNSTGIGGYGPVNQTKCVLHVPYQQWKWGGTTD